MQETIDTADRKTRVRDMLGLILAVSALVALVAIVVLAFVFLPAARRGENVVAVSTSAFGVIGTIVGAYFGIRTSHSAAKQLRQ